MENTSENHHSYLQKITMFSLMNCKVNIDFSFFFQQSYLNPENRRRFHCLLGGPLFLMSILSNFYFFMGTNVGHIFVQRATGTWPIGTPLLLFFMYCGAQTSVEVKNWEIRRKLTLKSALND
jgi:hypothetical protein